MALFKRRKPADTVPDEALPFLGVDDANAVRSLMREAFAERGREVTVYADHVASGGTQYGLWNVATACRATDRAHWPQTVREHVGRLLAAEDAPSPFDTMSADEVRARTYCRLFGADELPRADIPHVEFAPGIVELLALDLPDSVLFFHEEHVERFGGWAELQRHGRANLSREPDRPAIGVEGDNGARVNVLEGDSVYTASRALLLPGLSADAGDPPGKYGWLLTVPDRHAAVWHVIRDASVLPSLNLLVGLGLSRYAEGAAPVSPHTFWWNGSEYRRLTEIHDGGKVTIAVDPDLAEVLNTVVS